MTAIAANYPSPVTVNGFQCQNCTDVDRAKRFIDPAKPQAGPFGANDPTQATNRFAASARDPAQLSALSGAQAAARTSPVTAAYSAARAILPGSMVQISL